MRSGFDVRSRAWYLLVLFALPALAGFGHYVAPNHPVFKGHDWGVLITATALILAGLLWIPYRTRSRWPLVPSVVFALIAAGWGYQLISTQLDDSLFAISAIAVAAALLMIWIKPPTSSDISDAGLVLGYSLILISLASLILGGLGLLSDGFQVADSGSNRLIPTRELLGIENRWGGPFGSVNMAAPAGGLLIILGLLYQRWRRWIFVVSGVAILSLSQGRTAIIATLVAAVIFIAWSDPISRLARPLLARAALLGALMVGALAYVLRVDPIFSGRTPIWSDFWELSTQDPLTGIGESGVRTYLEALVLVQPDRFPHNHAHNVLLDLLAKHGIVSALLLVAAYVLSILITAKGLRFCGSAPLALVIYVIAEGLAETVYSLAYWSIHIAALLLAVMWASSALARSVPNVESVKSTADIV